MGKLTFLGLLTRFFFVRQYGSFVLLSSTFQGFGVVFLPTPKHPEL